MLVRRVVDLSHPLDAGTQVYPGDPVPRLAPHAVLERDGYNVLAVHLGSHSGTHVDAPYHVLDDGARLDELDLSLFVGPAVVLDVRGLPPGAVITPEVLGPLPALEPMVLLHTGWDRHWRTDAYLDHPHLDPRACRRLLDAGARVIGLDAPNIDRTPSRDLACHLLVARAGGAVVENLRGLEQLSGSRPFVSVLPIALAGADGAPARAVALELEPVSPPAG